MILAATCSIDWTIVTLWVTLLAFSAWFFWLMTR